MPMPDSVVNQDDGAGKEVAPVSPDSIMVKRVAEYLPEKRVEKTGNPQMSERFLAMSWNQWTGGFLHLADSLITSDKGVTSGAKDNLTNECTNTGLISALMLTIVLPMSYDAINDWLEEDYVGSGFLFQDSWIGQQLTAEQIQSCLGGFNDFALVFYVLGTLGYLTSTILTVLILLCVGELATDSACEEFLRRVGKATRAPYLLFMTGCGFAVPAALRYLVTAKTLPGLVIMCVVTGTMVFLIIFFSYYFVSRCIIAHNRINEYAELHLSNSEAKQDVEAWFERNGESGGHLQDCMTDLGGMVMADNSELFINISGLTRQRVAMHYHKLRAASVGVTLSEAELYTLSCQVPE